jgi:hypothetical protein
MSHACQRLKFNGLDWAFLLGMESDHLMNCFTFFFGFLYDLEIIIFFFFGLVPFLFYFVEQY